MVVPVGVPQFAGEDLGAGGGGGGDDVVERAVSACRVNLTIWPPLASTWLASRLEDL